ncbi:MAG: EAL domain-containing protein [Burkholderiales bacterium]|nr:EAL domain-containing protein [Burkholderiales bacterium]
MRRRVDAIIIGGAIVTVSGAVALTLWSGLGTAWANAALAGMATAIALLFLAVRHAKAPPAAAAITAAPASATPFAAPDAALLNRIESIENGLRAVARRCYELDQRLGDLDRQATLRSHETVKAVSSELSLLGSVVRDLAEAVALHDAELFSGTGTARGRAGPTDARREAPDVEPPGERIVPNAPAAKPTTLTIAAVTPARPAEAPAVETAPAAEPPAEPAIAQPPATTGAATSGATPPEAKAPETSQAVRRALVAGGVDLFLHSIVSLPQRKVRLYEALGRVRETDGSFAESDVVAAAAARLGLTAKLETDLFRSVCKVASHLAARERDVPVMCPVSLPTLRDPAYFAALAETVEADRQIPVRVVLRLRQSDVAKLGVMEGEALEAVRGLGFRFALDGVDDLRLDAHELASRGIRYVKVPAKLMLAASTGDAPSEIHPADLADLLARHGLSLVASDIETEATAIEIQDFSPQLGQGPLFSGPRPVRGDVLTTEPPRRPDARPVDQPATTETTAPPAAAPAPAAATAKPERLPLRAFLRRTTG